MQTKIFYIYGININLNVIFIVISNYLFCGTKAKSFLLSLLLAMHIKDYTGLRLLVELFTPEFPVKYSNSCNMHFIPKFDTSFYKSPQ